jgi:high-affinity iron transporter
MALAALSYLFIFPSSIGVADEPRFATWDEVASSMEKSLKAASETYATKGKDAWEEARDLVNDAYFGHYEKEGFERMVKQIVSGKRASKVEYQFATIKTKLKAGAEQQVIDQEIQTLITWLHEDAKALDARLLGSQAQGEGGSAAEGGEGSGQQRESRGLLDFFASLTILLREGFEAILVVAAIAAYLKRSGNEAQIKTVYSWGAAAVIASIIAAIAMQKILANAGQQQEVLEGITMLLATVVLFGVSNWMFSKAEAEAWKNYLENKVKAAVTRGSSIALGLAAFLAVFREGAETILFYQSLLSSAKGETTMIWAGFVVAALGLVVIFIVIRHGTMRLPLKPFFIGTSILMLIMSIAFLGGGIKELQEGDVFGVTPFPFITVDILGIYPCLETLVPQLCLLLLAVFSIIFIKKRQARSARPPLAA